jgi:hypothetical protein
MPFIPACLRRRSRAVALATTLAACGTFAPAASAGTISNPYNCSVSPTLSQVFAPFGDTNQYTPVSNQGLENGSAGWTLGSGASVVADNEPWAVSGPGTQALDLPNGSSAVTPPICINQSYPFFRFFAKDVNANGANLQVEVLFYTSTGKVQSKTPVTYSTAASGWQPTPAFSIGVWSSSTSTTQAPVAFRFTPMGPSAHFRIDDVYVDPWLRH